MTIDDFSEFDDALLPAGRGLSPGDFRLPAARAEFRTALAKETGRLVQRRSRQRRWARAGQFALAYAAGVLTVLALGRQLTAPQPKAVDVVVAPNKDAPSAAAPAPAAEQPKPATPTLAASPPAAPPKSDERRLSPEELRARVAGAPRDEQIRLLRLAGDRYLYDYEDVAAALHCYRQVLELDPPNQRRPFEPDDSWLLAELKNARVQQTRPAPPEA